MQVTSVNVGHERMITTAKRTEMTGIYKDPAPGPVMVGRQGLAGDVIVDTRNHGGPDQAVYIYGGEDYAWWEGELRRELAPGTFGENLTIAGLASAHFNIGDRLHAGGAVLEVTAPRIPCATLAARMGDPSFVKRYRQAGRPGLYCRVVKEGLVVAGDAVMAERFDGPTLTILEMFESHYDPQPDEALIRRHLAAPIAVRARVEQEARLRELRG